MAIHAIRGGHREIADPELIDQHTAHAHGNSHPLDPGAEAPVLGGLGGVADAAHAEVGEGVNNLGRREDDPHDGGDHAQHVGTERHQVHTGKKEGEVVAKVAHGIANLIS